MKQTFEKCNKEIQGHENEFNKIVGEYSSHSYFDQKGRQISDRIALIKLKYNQIRERKTVQNSTYMQSGMRMDSK